MRWYRKHPLTEGHPLWLAIAIGAGLLTAWAISDAVIDGAVVAARDPDNPIEISVFVALAYAYVGVTVGGIGACARAMVHNKPDRSDKIIDHVGKLLALSAFVFSLMGASLRLLETPYGADYPRIVVLVCLLILIVTMALRPAAKRRTAVREAAAATQLAEEQARREAEERERVSTRSRSRVTLALGVLSVVVSAVHVVTAAIRSR